MGAALAVLWVMIVSINDTSGINNNRGVNDDIRDIDRIIRVNNIMSTSPPTMNVTCRQKILTELPMADIIKYQRFINGQRARK